MSVGIPTAAGAAAVLPKSAKCVARVRTAPLPVVPAAAAATAAAAAACSLRGSFVRAARALTAVATDV